MAEKEYIEREALLENLHKFAPEHITPLIQLLVTKQPTADVAEVKHGEWKDTEYGTCSVCNRSISEIYDADSSMVYGGLDELTACPFCGAKMDGAKND